MTNPVIIQGGMGANVSNWLLARTVSRKGQLGVVSGTALDLVLSRRLQMGDPGGHIRRALNHFPVPEMAQRVLEKHFIQGGKSLTDAFKKIPMFSIDPPVALQELTVVANFAEVFLAKEGHDGVVGINYLEKIQLPNPASIYGAMLAGVDYVLVGAGIPREIPGVIDKLVCHEDVALMLNVEGATLQDDFKIRFNPKKLMGKVLLKLKHPRFLAIIASAILALTLVKKSTGSVYGFVIEGPTAGGHNALPRGPLRLNEIGEPIYGPKDEVDLEKIKSLGLPFWLAGSFGTFDRFKDALEQGASGIQVGTAFAFCKESGLAEDIKGRLLEKALKGEVNIFTDPKASPTGFPFKAVKLEGTNSEKEVYEARQRICDLGYLRHPYKKEDGGLGYRCPSEPIELYVKKGGKVEDTVGRKCLCNSLMANIGLPQRQKNDYIEKPFVTAGDDLMNIARFLKHGANSYSAEDIIKFLLEQSLH